jgi:predicted TIM-barrel fold metal-dependent hydrolase
LIVTLDRQGKPHYLPLVDFHTHIGRVKIETTKGSSQRVNMPKNIIQLYEKLQYEIHKRITQNPDDYYISLPSVDKTSRPLYPIVKQLLDLNGKGSMGWIVDQIISFPFNDIFHKQTKPKFVKSNQYIRHQLQSLTNCFRFIPFCRCDVTDEGADKEVRNSVCKGMRGLKLHPLSQGWIDKILSDSCKKILQTAGELHVPVIFDVPNKGVAIDITSISEDARSEISNPINVILGHSAFDYASKEIFECIGKNEMYTETSGMRGKDVDIFFKKVMEVDGWENKILFGTDSNYFGVLQAADFITFLLSLRFLDLLEAQDSDIKPLEVAAKILGGNALKLIPKAWNTCKTNPNEHITEIQDNNKIIQLTGDLKILNQILRKHLTQKNNTAVIDIAKLPKYNVTTQVLTLGSNSQKVPYVILNQEKDSTITLTSFPYDSKQDFNPNMRELTNVTQFLTLEVNVSSLQLSEKTLLESW